MASETTEERRWRISYEMFLVGLAGVAVAAVWLFSMLVPPPAASLVELSGTVAARRESKISDTEVGALYFTLTGDDREFSYTSELPRFEELRARLTEGSQVHMLVQKPPATAIWQLDVDGARIADQAGLQAARRSHLGAALLIGAVGIALLGYSFL